MGIKSLGVLKSAIKRLDFKREDGFLATIKAWRGCRRHHPERGVDLFRIKVHSDESRVEPVELEPG